MKLRLLLLGAVASLTSSMSFADDVIYPVSSLRDTTADYNANHSVPTTVLKAGGECHFQFYNYSKGKENFQNWILVAANNVQKEQEYFAFRNDNWEIVSWSNTGCTCNYNWDTFLTDMNGSFVDMKVTYKDGTANVSATITPAEGEKTYTCSYTKTFTGTVPDSLCLYFSNEKSYITPVKQSTNVNEETYYPETESKSLTNVYFQEFSQGTYQLESQKPIKLSFYTHNSGVNSWNSWVLCAAPDQTKTFENSYFILRNDNWDNKEFANTYCWSNYDWSTFTADMNHSKVDMTLTYDKTTGGFDMTANITTTDGKSYKYQYTKAIAADKPEKIYVFLTVDNSYISQKADPEPTTGISSLNADASATANGKIYNLSGQQVGGSYKGIMIQNGKKFVK